MTTPPPALGPLDHDWEEMSLPFATIVRSFVSGEPEGDRIRVRYYKTSEEKVLMGRIWFGPGAEGPPGHAHGGAQAAALDEICGGAVWSLGIKAVALTLETHFVTFVPLNTPLILRGIVKNREGKKIYTEGRILDASGKILARANALFIELNDKQLAKLAGFVADAKLATVLKD